MAIALDATASGVNDVGGTGAASVSKTISHTIGSGSNRAVVVAVGGVSAATPGTITLTATYNGTSMTSAVTQLVTSANRRIIGLFYLLDASLPAAGTYNVVVTSSDSSSKATAVAGAVYSFTGVAQSGQPDATGSKTSASAASISNTITTVADNSWIIDAIEISGGASLAANSPQANVLTLAEPTAVGNTGASTLGPVTPAGGTSTGWTWTTSAPGLAQMSLAPFAAAATNASAGVASATGTAYGAAPSLAPNAGNTTATGTAYTAAGSVSSASGIASATGSASGPSASLALSAGVATATGTALAPAPSLAVNAGRAQAIASAYDGTITIVNPVTADPTPVMVTMIERNTVSVREDHTATVREHTTATVREDTTATVREHATATAQERP